MPSPWLSSKKNELITDVLRNFCIIHRDLSHEFRHYRQTGQIRYSVLAELLGGEMNQGRLWRLKDSTHLLFRRFRDPTVPGRFLDWAIGYIFHECMKLREDAYQLQNYVPWFSQMSLNTELRADERSLANALYQFGSQTRESIDREVKRIASLLAFCRRIFRHYLPEHSQSHTLARFLYDQDELVRHVFEAEYEQLIQDIYGQRPERLFLLAARSLREGGRLEKARLAVSRAQDVCRSDGDVLHEKEIIDNMLRNW